MATPTPTPTLVDRSALDTELKNLFEARETTKRMAREVKAERESAEVQQVQEASREIATGPTSADAVADRVKRWQAEDQQKRDKINALTLLSKQLEDRLDDIKHAHRAEAAQWLQRQIAALEKEEDAADAKTRETTARVKALKQELNALESRKSGKPKRKARTGAPAKPKAKTPKPAKPKAKTPKPAKPKAKTPKPAKPKAKPPAAAKPKAKTPAAAKPKVKAPPAAKPKARTPAAAKPKAKAP